MNTKHIRAEHRVIAAASSEKEYLGYFAWPTVTRLNNGCLVAGASGYRYAHVCPFGKTVLWRSFDEGQSWSLPQILNDSMIDDRDVGLTSLPDGGFLVSWFTSDTRIYRDWFVENAPEQLKVFDHVISMWNDEAVRAAQGSFIRRVFSDDRVGNIVKVPITAPHGPIVLKSGCLLYIGAPYSQKKTDPTLHVFSSMDKGTNWEKIGNVKPAEISVDKNENRILDEPHLLELPSGRLLGFARNDRTFAVTQFESDDGGRSWTSPHTVIEYGSPPFAMRHSSGTLILCYGYRKEPFGIRVAFSCDEGESWNNDWIIRDDGTNGDIGYPSTVELGDGSLLTVYYQTAAPNVPCGIFTSHWSLPF